MKPLKLVVCGALGQMGRRIIALAQADNRLEVAAGVRRPEDGDGMKDVPLILQDAYAKTIERADISIDFSAPSASVYFAEQSAQLKKPIVIGTTGFEPAHLEKIKSLSERTPIFMSPNFSAGMNVLYHIAERAAAALRNYDAGIHEIHHTKKKDAPSGSALRLAESVRRGNGRTPPITSQRLGTVVGDHSLLLAGGMERLEISHHAESRDIFARGALDAAIWVAKKTPGLYDMSDLLDLK